MTKNEKNAAVKWTMFISFIVLLIGGLNYLFMGLFTYDLFGNMFGYESTVGRVIFTMFGLAAVILMSVMLWKSYKKEDAKPARRSTSS